MPRRILSSKARRISVRVVFDLRNQLAGRVEVLRFPDFIDDREPHTKDEGEVPTGFGLAEASASDPTGKLMSAFDLTRWLEELSVEDQDLLALRAAGYTLEEIADKTGMSVTSVFGNCRRLGVGLAEHAGIRIEVRKHKDSAVRVQPTERARSSAADTPDTKRGGPKKASRTRPPETVPWAA
jgi:hypothetical protein